jgi:hypothetical protein
VPRPDLEWSGLTLQNWLLAREASHVPDCALGLKAAVVLPFEQPVGALVHSQSVVAIDLVRQARRDLTSEAMKPSKDGVALFCPT